MLADSRPDRLLPAPASTAGCCGGLFMKVNAASLAGVNLLDWDSGEASQIKRQRRRRQVRPHLGAEKEI
jgi:hypothetical protein